MSHRISHWQQEDDFKLCKGLGKNSDLDNSYQHSKYVADYRVVCRMKGKGKVPAVGGSDDSGDGKGKPSVGGTGHPAVGGKGQLLVFWQEVCHSNPTSRIWRQLAICGGKRSFVGLCLRWAVEFNGVGWLGWMGKANESVYNVKLTMVLGFNLTVGYSCQASTFAICRPIAAGTVVVVGVVAA